MQYMVSSDAFDISLQSLFLKSCIVLLLHNIVSSLPPGRRRLLEDRQMKNWSSVFVPVVLVQPWENGKEKTLLLRSDLCVGRNSPCRNVLCHQNCD